MDGHMLVWITCPTKCINFYQGIYFMYLTTYTVTYKYIKKISLMLVASCTYQVSIDAAMDHVYTISAGKLCFIPDVGYCVNTITL